MLPVLDQLILASASPRRRDLLLQLQPALKLTSCPPAIDESLLTHEEGDERVLRLAAAKARCVLAMQGDNFSRMPLLAADTEVVMDGQPLGKPESLAEATEFLQRLSGRAHEVKTGVVLADQQTWLQALVTTQVFFRPLESDEIQAYAATGEGKDKAGGYAIQGQGAALVKRIEGSYSNVVGLPLETFILLLRQLGYRVF